MCGTMVKVIHRMTAMVPMNEVAFPCIVHPCFNRFNNG